MQITVYVHIPRKRSHNFSQIKSIHLTRQVGIIDFFLFLMKVCESLTEENRFGPQLQREQSYSVRMALSFVKMYISRHND